MKTLETNVVKVAEALRALGHPIRVEIIRIIGTSKGGRLTVKQIQECLGITQPEASKHLAVLRNGSVLLCERKDGYSYYHINSEFAFIKQLVTSLNRK